MVRACLSMVASFFCGIAVADIPPPPDPAVACSNQEEGDSCHAYIGPGVWYGTCQRQGTILKCAAVEDNQPKVVAKVPTPPAGGPEKHQGTLFDEEGAPMAEGQNIQAQGCSTATSIPAGLLPLVSLLLGLFLLMRIRRS